MYYERYTRIARNVILKTKRAMPANVPSLQAVCGVDCRVALAKQKHY